MKSATFESGLSDHRKLLTTFLKKTLSKGNFRPFNLAKWGFSQTLEILVKTHKKLLIQ